MVLRKTFRRLLTAATVLSLSYSTVLVSRPANAVQPLFTVTFHLNVPGQPDTTVSQTSATASNLLAFSSTGFSNPNYYFEDWKSTNGTIYVDQENYPFSADLDLYAQWVQDSHTVTFYRNISASDTTHSFQTMNSPTDLTLISQLGFDNPNHVFTGWTTQSNGTGSKFDDGQQFSFVSDQPLYAQWALATEAIVFSSGAGVGTQPEIDSTFGSSITLPNGSSLSRTNYTFAGWNTQPDGKGTSLKAGDSYVVNGSVTLYAMWSRNHDRVSFNVEAGRSRLSSVNVLAGIAVHLPSVKIRNPGHHFVGWFTAATGGSLVGKGGATYSPKSSLTLFAHWKNNPTVHLEFSDNGGLGHIPARNVLAGQSAVVPTGAQLHRPGFTFRGWATSPHAATPTLRIGSKLTLVKNKILFALWRKNLPVTTPVVLLGGVGIFSPNSSVLSAAMRHDIAVFAINVNSHNRTQVLLYGYATALDSAKGSALLSLQRALAVEKQLNKDLVGLNDVGVNIVVKGEGRLTNSVLTSFRKVEVFAN